MAQRRKTVARNRRSFGRIRKLPSGRYQASYQGQDLKVYTAPVTYSAKIDAEAWLTDRRRELDRDLWSPPATAEQTQAKRKASVTFKDYSDKWMETRLSKGERLRPRTLEDYRKLLDRHILPTFATKAVRDITRDDVRRWYDRTCLDTPVQRAHAYGLLRTILETARTADDLIDTNPCAIAGAGSAKSTHKPKPLNFEQLGIVVENMPERFRLMILLGCWNAMRFGELIELRRKDIDLDAQVVKVHRAAVRVKGKRIIGKPKSDAGIRDIAIPPNIIAAIEHHLGKHVDTGKDALLFPAASGAHLQPSTLYRHFYRARDAAGRPDLRFHDLRHTGAVLAAQAGATLAELMERLGHSTPQAAMRYQHAAAGRDREIAARMARLAD